MKLVVKTRDGSVRVYSYEDWQLHNGWLTIFFKRNESTYIKEDTISEFYVHQDTFENGKEKEFSCEVVK